MSACFCQCACCLSLVPSLPKDTQACILYRYQSGALETGTLWQDPNRCPIYQYCCTISHGIIMVLSTAFIVCLLHLFKVLQLGRAVGLPGAVLNGGGLHEAAAGWGAPAACALLLAPLTLPGTLLLQQDMCKHLKF